MKNLLALIRVLRGLLRVPSVEDEAEFRRFLESALRSAAALAAYTLTKVDDLAVKAAQTLVADDQLWAVFYRLLRFAGGQSDVDVLVERSGLSPDEVLALRDGVHEITAEPLRSGFGSLA